MRNTKRFGMITEGMDERETGEAQSKPRESNKLVNKCKFFIMYLIISLSVQFQKLCYHCKGRISNVYRPFVDSKFVCFITWAFLLIDLIMIWYRETNKEKCCGAKGSKQICGRFLCLNELKNEVDLSIIVYRNYISINRTEN